MNELSIQNYQDELTRLEQRKLEANNLFIQNLFNEAIDIYLKIDQEIDNLLKGFVIRKETEGVFKQIINFKKIIFANLANSYNKIGNKQESVKYDETIICSMDTKFERSYERLLNNYIALADYTNADKIRKLLLSNFDQTTTNSYIRQFSEIDSKLTKKSRLNVGVAQIKRKHVPNEPEGLITDNHTFQSDINKENKEENKEKDDKRLKNNLYINQKFILGGLLLILSFTGIILVIKNKSYFHKP